MSTKIYNVYKFDGKHRDIVPFLDSLREKTKEELTNRIDKWIYRDYPIQIQFPTGELSKKPSEIEYASEIRWLLEYKRQNLGVRTDQLHYDPTAVVYFYNNDIFIQFFDFKFELTDYPQLSDYHYQNSTDMSNYDWRNENWNDMSDVRKEELTIDWTTRQYIWDQIFTSDRGNPKTAGLSYSLLPSNWEIDEIIISSKIKYKKEDQ